MILTAFFISTIRSTGAISSPAIRAFGRWILRGSVGDSSGYVTLAAEKLTTDFDPAWINAPKGANTDVDFKFEGGTLHLKGTSNEMPSGLGLIRSILGRQSFEQYRVGFDYSKQAITFFPISEDDSEIKSWVGEHPIRIPLQVSDRSIVFVLEDAAGEQHRVALSTGTSFSQTTVHPSFSFTKLGVSGTELMTDSNQRVEREYGVSTALKFGGLGLPGVDFSIVDKASLSDHGEDIEAVIALDDFEANRVVVSLDSKELLIEPLSAAAQAFNCILRRSGLPLALKDGVVEVDTSRSIPRQQELFEDLNHHPVVAFGDVPVAAALEALKSPTKNQELIAKLFAIRHDSYNLFYRVDGETRSIRVKR